MLVGYGRVSTVDQNPGLQITALEAAGCERLFVDKASGTKTEKDRPELAKVLAYLNRGDVLVVWRLDRFGRSFNHLVQMIQQLQDRGIGFKSLTETFIDTTSEQGLLLLRIFAAIAQYERSMMLERTNAGIAEARLNGVKFGAPRTIDEALVDQGLTLYARGVSVSEILLQTGLVKQTFYKYLNERGVSKRGRADKPKDAGAEDRRHGVDRAQAGA
jgi:DNA invertase Pin-like site-specific DNA recombinase